MSEAYGELWSRHSGAVIAGARSYTGYDPNDLMQEAFLKVYASIQDGGPLPISFRAYVATTARRLAIDKSRQDRGALHDPIDDALDHPALSDEDFSHRMLEDTSTAQAFRELPSRYREVLWYRDVEDLPVQEIARYVGASANSTSVLIKRARDAFKTAWIRVQLSPKRDLDPVCAGIVPKLAAYSNGKLSTKDRDRVDLHLLDCTHCAALAAEADSLHKKLALVLLPLLLLGGSPGYLAWIQKRQNRTPIPDSANYVNVRLDGVRTSPIATGTALLAPAAALHAPGTLTKPVAVAVAAMLVLGAGVAGAVTYPGARVTPGSEVLVEDEAISTFSGDERVRGDERTGVKRDRDSRADTVPTAGADAAEDRTIVLDVVSPEGNLVPTAPPVVPPVGPNPDIEPEPEPELEPEPEPVSYPARVPLSLWGKRAPHTNGSVFIGTPGGTMHFAVTVDGLTQSFAMDIDEAGEVYFTFPGYSGVVVSVQISQEYDTAEGRVLDPATMLFPRYVVFVVRSE